MVLAHLCHINHLSNAMVLHGIVNDDAKTDTHTPTIEEIVCVFEVCTRNIFILQIQLIKWYKVMESNEKGYSNVRPLNIDF